MFDPQRHLEKQEDILQDQLSNGEITIAEYNAEVRELQRDYQAMADEAAWGAYEDERSRW